MLRQLLKTCIPGLLFSLIPLKAQIIVTRAGNGTSGFSGDGGQAIFAKLNNPRGTVIDAAGSIYIADFLNSSVRKVAPTGIITTVAGNQTSGYSGDGGPATAAKLSFPAGLALDASGNLYIADQTNDVIRMVNSLGIISTVAGNGTQGMAGDGGPATAAQLYDPSGVAFDAQGNMYIADTWNNKIRKVNTSGIISTLSGNGTQGYAGDGGPASGGVLNLPGGIVIDPAGNIYIADTWNFVVRKIDLSGAITTIAGNNTMGYSGDGGSATSASLTFTSGIMLDAAGNIYVCDQYNNRIRMINGSGIINTVVGNGTQGFSGDGGPATAAELYQPIGNPALDARGNMYFTDSKNNRLRKICISPPSLTVSGNASVCMGAATILSAHGASTYTWSSNAGSATTSSVSLSPTVTATYSLVGTDSTGCFNTNSLTVTVNPAPNVQAIASSTLICSGTMVTLSSVGASTYTWLPGGATTTTISVLPATTTVYTVTGAIGNCQGVQTVYTFSYDFCRCLRFGYMQRYERNSERIRGKQLHLERKCRKRGYGKRFCFPS